jgi:hypothetical protein
MTKRTPDQIIGIDALMQLIFEGYAVVPTEPTHKMIHSVWLQPLGERRFNGHVSKETEVVNTDTSAAIYRKMIGAV